MFTNLCLLLITYTICKCLGIFHSLFSFVFGYSYIFPLSLLFIFFTVCFEFTIDVIYIFSLSINLPLMLFPFFYLSLQQTARTATIYLLNRIEIKYRRIRSNFPNILYFFPFLVERKNISEY